MRYRHEMRWSDVRTRLLPTSGIGVVAPWLVIAPAGSSIIRIDLRFLDRVELGTCDDGDDSTDEAHRRSEVRFACGDLEISLHIADGPEAAERIVRQRTRCNTASLILIVTTVPPGSHECLLQDLCTDLQCSHHVGGRPMLRCWNSDRRRL